jgi:hypothetical protein
MVRNGGIPERKRPTQTSGYTRRFRNAPGDGRPFLNADIRGMVREHIPPTRPFLILDLEGRVGEYLPPADLENLNRLSRERWLTLAGQHRPVFVNAENIESIVKAISNDTNTLKNATFEIRVFDGAFIVQELFGDLCQHVSNLKINFRFKTSRLEQERMHKVRQRGLSHDFGHRGHKPVITDDDERRFTGMVVRTLGVLKNAPGLLSLSLDFDTDENRMSFGIPRIHMGIDGFNALATLKDAPVLQSLHLDLCANDVDTDDVRALSELRHSKTLQTVSVKLNANYNVGSVGAICLARLAIAPALKNLSLHFFGTPVGDDGVKDICHILQGQCHHLETLHLDLGCTRIGTNALHALIGMSNECSLKTIYIQLYDNDLGDNGANILTDLGRGGGKNITLGLGANGISDDYLLSNFDAVDVDRSYLHHYSVKPVARSFF